MTVDCKGQLATAYQKKRAINQKTVNRHIFPLEGYCGCEMISTKITLKWKRMRWQPTGFEPPILCTKRYILTNWAKSLGIRPNEANTDAGLNVHRQHSWSFTWNSVGVSILSETLHSCPNRQCSDIELLTNRQLGHPLQLFLTLKTGLYGSFLLLHCIIPLQAYGYHSVI